jgi:hypothetical protein
MNNGIAYEQLNKEIFQAILNQSEVKNIDVQHNVLLYGKTTSHQIDVYWEFELESIVYKTVVQAKNWSKPVNKGELLKFKGVLDDLPGQPKGIFVTRSGYQRGANVFAKANGIELLELIEIDHTPIQIKSLGYGLIVMNPTPILIMNTGKKSITFIAKVFVFNPKFENNILEYDFDWLCSELQLSRNDIKSKASKIQWPIKQPVDHKFYDFQGNIINDLGNIYQHFMKELNTKDEIKKDMCYKFDDPTCIFVDNFDLPFIKILSVSTSVTIIRNEPIEMHLQLPNIVQFVVKNLIKKTQIIIGQQLLQC